MNKVHRPAVFKLLKSNLTFQLLHISITKKKKLNIEDENNYTPSSAVVAFTTSLASLGPILLTANTLR